MILYFTLINSLLLLSLLNYYYEKVLVTDFMKKPCWLTVSEKTVELSTFKEIESYKHF